MPLHAARRPRVRCLLPGRVRVQCFLRAGRRTQGCECIRELEMWTKGGMRIICPYYHLWSTRPACKFTLSNERVPLISPTSARRHGPNIRGRVLLLNFQKHQVNKRTSASLWQDCSIMIKYWWHWTRYGWNDGCNIVGTHFNLWKILCCKKSVGVFCRTFSFSVFFFKYSNGSIFLD